MQLLVTPDGHVRCLYLEAIDLTVLGQLTIRRASHVEPDERGQWRADMRLIGGPALGSFQRRSDALAAETAWLSLHWLGHPAPG